MRFNAHLMIKRAVPEVREFASLCTATAVAKRTVMPRSARWRDGEHLATGDHEIVRVAWVPDLGKSCVERGLEQGSWIAGTQFEPCAELGLLVVRRVVGEFDAEMPAAGKTDHEHRLVDARELDGPHRAAQERLKALSQFLAPVCARRYARCCQERPRLADPSCRSWGQPELSPSTVASSHKTRSRRPLLPFEDSASIASVSPGSDLPCGGEFRGLPVRRG